MKKLVKTALVTILLSIAATSLFAVSGSETAVIRLTAYVPEKTTFNTYEDEFIVASNAHNFSYSVLQRAGTKMLFVIAN